MAMRRETSSGHRAHLTRGTIPALPAEPARGSPDSPLRNRRYVAPGPDVATEAPQTRTHGHDPYSRHVYSRPAERRDIPFTPEVTPSTGRINDSPHGSPSHPSGTHSVEGNRKPVCIRMLLPPSFPETTAYGETRHRELRSWRDLPANPLIGLPGLATPAAPVDREDCKFYCDACQKGFFAQERYDKHMLEHIWCTVPGCRFTCRKGKEWKMEMHMETLHNRPDAPDLADVGTYLSQRKQRFPTQDAVKSKVEELFYKASRGVILPDERRRWLRQHGVLVRKRPRTEEAYIDSDALQQSARAATSKAAERHRRQQQQQHANEEEPEEKEEVTERQRLPVPTPPHHAEEAAVREHLPTAAEHPPAPGRPKRIIPLGPNGTLTRGQRVQLIRERYRDAKTVPSFYVCPRCGEKGRHWVDECPTRGDETFERRTVWGEERREPPRQRRRTERDAEEAKPAAQNAGDSEGQVDDAPAPSGGDDRGTQGGVASPCDGEGRAEAAALELVEDDGGPPAELSARRHDNSEGATNATPEVSRMLAPVAAAALSRRGRRPQEGQSRQSQPARSRPRPPPPPTLYERLVESRKASEQGLLLQAFRFFVMRRFFEPL
ncbi:zinc finger protein [Trypanosoma conorhini]|uniref:Zinc finger protein n=1 Tax=Trypanosoma conorhini TaxID=83891 RepID=A0A3R7NMK1_9TRYP|nr:zinc finger protein [Trypanosoma conorhini]RNF20589.1 zinc finger protein [Trypanosoma conorhini]